MQKVIDKNLSCNLVRIGEYYSESVCVKKSNKKAAEYYERAGELGESNGYHQLAYLYANGEGVEKSLSKAFELFNKAADMGDEHAKIQVGKMFYIGDGVLRNRVQACTIWRTIAETGEKYAIESAIEFYSKGECDEFLRKD
jgi:TPR repeat protein